MSEFLLSITTDQLSLVANYSLLLCAALALKNWKLELSGKTNIEDKRNFFKSARLLSESQTNLCKACLHSLTIKKISLEKNNVPFRLDDFAKQSINNYKNATFESSSKLSIEMQHNMFTSKNKELEKHAKTLIEACEEFTYYANKTLALEREDVKISEDDLETINQLINSIKKSHERIITKQRNILIEKPQ